jgi:hypothetical protein
MTGGGVPVDQAFPGRAVQETDRRELLVRRGASGTRPFEGGAQCRALRPIADGRCAGLAHVLLRGRDIGHELTPRFQVIGEWRKLRAPIADVKAPHSFDTPLAPG